MKIDGSCQCGHITFQGEADPDKAWICHCTDCQAGTGTAFRINVPIPAASFRMLSGTPTIFVKTTAESGTPREQAFCGKCGSPIFSTNVGEPKQSYTVRIGLLRQRDQFAPKKQNWFRSALPWTTRLDAVHKNPKQG